jgi:hypothetical protein
VERDAPVVDDGLLVHQVLDTHRQFIVQSYSLLRFIQGELQRNGLRLVQGTGVARNGSGSGLNAVDDWVQTYVGLPFVSSTAPTETRGGSRLSVVSSDGLRVLLIQIRWLSKANNGAPAVWVVDGKATVEQDEETVGFEPYYWSVFSKLERHDVLADRIAPITSRPLKKYPLLAFDGRLREFPLVTLGNEDDVRTGLVAPALELWNSPE